MPLSTEDLVGVREIRALSLSPNGERVVFRVDRAIADSNDYRQVWYAMDTAAGATARLIADGGEARFAADGVRLPDNVCWSDGGRAIIFIRQLAGMSQVWRYAFATGRTVQVTHNAGNVLDLQCLDDRRARLVVEAPREQLKRIEDSVAQAGLVIDSTMDLWRSPLPLVPRALAGYRETWTLDLTARSEQRDTMPTTPERLDERAYRSYRITQRLKHAAVGAALRDCTGETVTVMCEYEAALAPPEVVAVDTTTGEYRILTHFNANLRLTDYLTVQRFDFPPTQYGSRYLGYLVMPVRDTTVRHEYPLVITTLDATGFLKGAHGDQFPIPLLATNGIAVLAWDGGDPDFDGPSNTDEERFRRALASWDSPLQGFLIAIDTLTRLGTIDPTRVGLTGQSHGAEFVDYAISHSHAFCAAATGNDGSRDPNSWYLIGNRMRSIYAAWGLDGIPSDETAGRWRAVSAALNARAIETPLLVQGSMEESSFSWQLFSTMRQLREPVEMVVYHSERHNLIEPVHRKEVYDRTIDWFRYWLQGARDDFPEKIGEYRRWDDLRHKAEAAGIRPCNVTRPPLLSGGKTP